MFVVIVEEDRARSVYTFATKEEADDCAAQERANAGVYVKAVCQGVVNDVWQNPDYEPPAGGYGG
jgi:hypothetical protein